MAQINDIVIKMDPKATVALEENRIITAELIRALGEVQHALDRVDTQIQRMCDLLAKVDADSVTK